MMLKLFEERVNRSERYLELAGFTSQLSSLQPRITRLPAPSAYTLFTKHKDPEGCGDVSQQARTSASWYFHVTGGMRWRPSQSLRATSMQYSNIIHVM